MTLPFGVSVWITCWYWAAAALSISADDTRRSWLRWTPTVPSSVVVEHATSTVAASSADAARPMMCRFIGGLLSRADTELRALRLVRASMIEASAKGSRPPQSERGSLTTPRPRRSMPGKEDVMDRRDILAERPLESGRGFMPGVSINPSRVLFTAGLTGRDPDGNLVAGGMGPQARRTFERLQAILSKADARFDNVVKQLTYVTDLDAYNASGRAERAQVLRRLARRRQAWSCGGWPIPTCSSRSSSSSTSVAPAAASHCSRSTTWRITAATSIRA